MVCISDGVFLKNLRSVVVTKTHLIAWKVTSYLYISMRDQNLYWFLGFQQAVFLHLLIYLFCGWHLWLAEQSARLWYAGRFQDDWAQTLTAGHMTASWLCHVLPAARLPLTYRAAHSFTLSPNKRALILILRGRLPRPHPLVPPRGRRKPFEGIIVNFWSSRSWKHKPCRARLNSVQSAPSDIVP